MSIFFTNLARDKIKMGIIVAIGGGEMGRTKVLSDGTIKTYPIETLSIDQKVVELANKKNPNLLFLGTALSDRQSYIDIIEQYYGKKLGCNVLSLNLVKDSPSHQIIQEKIRNADIVYVGSGDTRKMLQIWKQYGVDQLLYQAYNRGCVMAGISAGAICWFEFYDNMDYIEAENVPLGLLPGLGFTSGFAVPHYDLLETTERNKLKKLLNTHKISGWGIDECSALIINNGVYSTLSSKKGKITQRIL